jgi:hypothetical protein
MIDIFGIVEIDDHQNTVKLKEGRSRYNNAESLATAQSACPLAVATMKGSLDPKKEICDEDTCVQRRKH